MPCIAWPAYFILDMFMFNDTFLESRGEIKTNYSNNQKLDRQLFHYFEWYFVTKIVLTYCEKKLL